MTELAKPLELSEVALRLQSLPLRYPIQRMAVFGSVARGDASPLSDVDLLVTLSRGVTTDELLDMAGEAEELVGRRVDFVQQPWLDKSSNSEARRHILETAVCIYGC